MKWKEKETDKLIELWADMSKEELMNEFPKRTWNSITSKAERMKLTKIHRRHSIRPAEKKILQYKRQAMFFQKEYEKILTQHIDVNNLVERMKEVLTTIKPKGVFKMPSYKTSQEEEEMILLFQTAKLVLNH